MKVIVVGSEKGGVGKSTVSISLSAYLSRKFNVILFDADPIGTSRSWASIRASSDKKHLRKIKSINNYGCDLSDQIKYLKSSNDYQYLIIDTAARDSIELNSSLIHADVFLLPLEPSILSMSLIKHAMSINISAQNKNPFLKSYIFFNRCNPSYNSFKSMKGALDNLIKGSGFEPLPNLPNRQSFLKSYQNGMGITEYSDAKASDKFIEFVNEIKL